jgi:hypothetical protein
VLQYVQDLVLSFCFFSFFLRWFEAQKKEEENYPKRRTNCDGFY